MSSAGPSEAIEGNATPAPLGFRAMLHVFHHRNFRLFFFGQFMSLLGTWLQNVAVGWLVYDMTRSPFLLGLTMFLQQAPIFFLAAFAGTYVDRIGRRRMMALTQILFCIQSVVLATLTLSGNITIEILLVLAIFYGLVNAFDGPVRHGFAYELVGRADVKAAIAVNSMQFNIARMVGPSIAGFLILVIGEGGCFALNSVSFAFTLGVLYFLRLPPHEKREHKTPLRAIKEAFDYLREEPVIRTALLMTGLATVFGGAFLSLMPAFARDVVHADPRGLGFLMAAIGLGALFGTITLAHIPDKKLDNVPIYTAIGMGLSLILCAQTAELWLSLVAVLPASACLMLGGSSANTIMQMRAREDMRSRMVAFYSMCFIGALPWGALIIGSLASFIGIGHALTLGGIVCALLGLSVVVARRLPRPAHP